MRFFPWKIVYYFRVMLAHLELWRKMVGSSAGATKTEGTTHPADCRCESLHSIIQFDWTFFTLCARLKRLQVREKIRKIMTHSHVNVRQHSHFLLLIGLVFLSLLLLLLLLLAAGATYVFGWCVIVWTVKTSTAPLWRWEISLKQLTRKWSRRM